MKTLNKAVARYNGISLIVRILIGLFIGAVLALVAPGAGWVGELGSLFVGALKGTRRGNPRRECSQSR
mgnify:CR=1 FL=1